MMESRRQNASKLQSMPLASMFANSNWDNEFDDLAGLLASPQTSDGDSDKQNDSIDQALMDLFGG
jgi:hypothetical protein